MSVLTSKKMGRELSLTFQEKAEPSSGGRPSKVYLLGKRETLILVSGYNLEMRAKIIDRWQQLESQQAFDPATVLESPAAMRGLLLTSPQSGH
jgi:phage regulator Rha-like protein